MTKKKLILQLLATVGFILTIKLAFIYYVANYQKYALASFCSINDFIDCDGAARTTTAQFLGIPLAYWGMLFYSIVLFLTFVDSFKKIKFLKFLEVFKNPISYISALGTFAFGVSMILAGISVYKINKLCILCVITYVIDLLIALAASSGSFKQLLSDVKITAIDFVDGVKKYTKTFIVLLILAVSFLSYSEITYCFVPHMKKQREFIKYKNMKKNPYRVNGNVLGNEKGDVKIILYSDYVCPMCYIHNIMLHKAAKEFSNIYIEHYNMPFDKECNKYVSFNMHPNACFMARAAIAARMQGNYWGMSSLLYENQPANKESLSVLVAKLKLDSEQFFEDFDSDKVKNNLTNDIESSAKLQLDSTPTMFVNGKKYVGIMPYEKLKGILIDHGAKR